MELFQLTVGDGPLVAAAIHSGHGVRQEVAEQLALSEADRLREEDPFTDHLIDWAPTQLIGLRSRYEFDLNRPRDEAVYLVPDQCWGVNAWKCPPAREVVDRSLQNYDTFYAVAHAVLSRLIALHGRVIVLDVHSYNHRRAGADGTLASPEENPEVNVGTGSLDTQRWWNVSQVLIDRLRGFDFLGRRLDVRENIKFFGGHFCRWIHRTFPASACALAVEFKKFFMDEWTGEVDRRQLAELRKALQSTSQQLSAALAASA
jgi:N-formylglutamate amidohydrolase